MTATYDPISDAMESLAHFGLDLERDPVEPRVLKTHGNGPIIAIALNGDAWDIYGPTSAHFTGGVPGEHMVEQVAAILNA